MELNFSLCDSTGSNHFLIQIKGHDRSRYTEQFTSLPTLMQRYKDPIGYYKGCKWGSLLSYSKEKGWEIIEIKGAFNIFLTRLAHFIGNYFFSCVGKNTNPTYLRKKIKKEFVDHYIRGHFSGDTADQFKNTEASLPELTRRLKEKIRLIQKIHKRVSEGVCYIVAEETTNSEITRLMLLVGNAFGTYAKPLFQFLTMPFKITKAQLLTGSSVVDYMREEESYRRWLSNVQEISRDQIKITKEQAEAALKIYHSPQKYYAILALTKNKNIENLPPKIKETERIKQVEIISRNLESVNK